MTESAGTRVEQSCATRDLAENKLAWLLWGVPLALIAAGVVWAKARAWLWAPALVVAGVACLVNARRCGRLHCYFTGPLFLLGAVATVLRQIDILQISWAWLGGGLIVGNVLAFVPEWVRGKYASRHPGNAGQTTCS
jgi:hypothetical protein